MQSTDLWVNQPQLFPRTVSPLDEKQTNGLTTISEANLSIASWVTEYPAFLHQLG